MKKFLILGIPFDLRKGGAEYQYKILEEYLTEKFEVYYLFRYATPLNTKRYLNYNYRFRKRYNPNLYTDALVIYRLIKRLSPDIIYMRSVNYIAAIGAHYAKSNNAKMVLHIASQRDVEKPKYNSGISAIFQFSNQHMAKYAINNANQVICQAQYQNHFLHENYGRNCDLVLPNMQPIPENDSKKKLPIKIIWISNIKPLKQPELFIDLAENFKNSRNIEFIMIGRPASGSWQDKLTNKINRLPNLKYRGELSINQVNTVLRESHILVNTSEYEGFPNTYIQAWMRKVPVVALNSDPDDIIKKNNIGFHSKTYGQMFEDVKNLIENKQLRERIGEKSSKFARTYFSVTNMDKFVDLLDQL
jgi:glycosyltransferase involved in cell wall biosynthesis